MERNSFTKTGVIRSWWQQGMNSSFKTTYDCMEDFSETDFTEDLKRIDIPVLVLHGDDDQIVPFEGREMKGDARDGAVRV